MSNDNTQYYLSAGGASQLEFPRYDDIRALKAHINPVVRDSPVMYVSDAGLPVVGLGVPVGTRDAIHNWALRLPWVKLTPGRAGHLYASEQEVRNEFRRVILEDQPARLKLDGSVRKEIFKLRLEYLYSTLTSRQPNFTWRYPQGELSVAAKRGLVLAAWSFDPHNMPETLHRAVRSLRGKYPRAVIHTLRGLLETGEAAKKGRESSSSRLVREARRYLYMDYLATQNVLSKNELEHIPASVFRLDSKLAYSIMCRQLGDLGENSLSLKTPSVNRAHWFVKILLHEARDGMFDLNSSLVNTRLEFNLLNNRTHVPQEADKDFLFLRAYSTLCKLRTESKFAMGLHNQPNFREYTRVAPVPEDVADALDEEDDF